MRKLFFCLLLVNCLDARSQSLKWHEGSIVLISGDVFVGMMVIDPSLDVVLVQQNETRTVYPSHKISSLYFYDASADINRRFVSLKEESTLYTHYRLFEIVVQGEVSVLRKQKTRFTNPSDALDYIYYVSYRDDLVLLSQFGKKIYPELKAAMTKLNAFVDANNLHNYDDANSIRIIEFYNRQLRAESLTATLPLVIP